MSFLLCVGDHVGDVLKAKKKPDQSFTEFFEELFDIKRPKRLGPYGDFYALKPGETYTFIKKLKPDGIQTDYAANEVWIRVIKHALYRKGWKIKEKGQGLKWHVTRVS